MSYDSVIAKNKQWIDQTWNKLDEKLSRIAVKSRYKIPYTTIDGVHDDHSQGEDIVYWTNGFWGGLMWQMYAGTKKDCYKITAEESERLLDNAFNYLDRFDHDVGFMWDITSGANYRLTGNLQSKNRNVLAAMSLMSRYNVDGNYIRCWNDRESDDVKGWSIIDCMMNLPLLYWASKELNDERFARVAMRHADMTMRDHVREDGSVNHIVIHDTEKPDTVLGIRAGQGYAVDSCWSRGASWALYGFMLSYIYTKKEDYLKTAKKVADYFIKETEKTGWLPLLDFRQPPTPLFYDSTAGAIASCGLIELAKAVTDPAEQEKYLSAALNIMQAMEKNWCDWTDKEDSVLQMGSMMYNCEIHINIIYGDYFFGEAMLKLKGTDFLAW